jgi:ribonuclease HII
MSVGETSAGGFVIGVDEAGRGPLAGPVVAAAVILDPARPIAGLADSKALKPAARERLAREIETRALAWAVGVASAAEIDAINILQASLLAMRRAVAALALRGHVLVDGNRLPDFSGLMQVESAEAIIKGDSKEPAISAASILAKTLRDRGMVRLARRYPNHGFEIHKGYPTPAHLAALREHGVTAEHRLSFGPVKSLLS